MKWFAKTTGINGRLLHPKDRIAIDGFEIDVRTNGERGIPIVMVHGIGVSGNYFMPLAEELATTYTVYVLDLPGYGTTPKPRHALSINQLAALIAQFIERNHLVQPVLVGHSMGCQIIARVGEQYPLLVHKQILLSPTVNRDERTVGRQSFRLLQDTMRESWRTNLVIFHDYLLFGMSFYIQTLRYMLDDTIESRFRASSHPVLVIRGEKDVIVPKAWVDELVGHMPQGSSREVLGQLHAFHFNQPRQTADLCRDFIHPTGGDS
jgi:pimeloyl-ACP methyl ester carboxylesterase